MNWKTILAAGAILFSGTVWAVDCTPHEIVLSTQAEVNDYQLNHGPCDRVLGHLTIEGDDIQNLNGL